MLFLSIAFFGPIDGLATFAMMAFQGYFVDEDNQLVQLNHFLAHLKVATPLLQIENIGQSNCIMSLGYKG